MNVAVRPSKRPIVSFENVSKYYATQKKPKYILRNATFDLPFRANIALMGANGAGKSTVLRMIAGTEHPVKGRVRRWGSVSWPLGFNGGFDKGMTARENTTFVARVYGADPEAICDYVEDFAELGRYFDMPVSSYSSGMKQKLNFGLVMALDFDCYLVDEVTAVGDDRFREKCQRAFAERRETAGVIMVSHSFPTLRAYCDSAAILVDGEMFYFNDLEEGIAEFRCLLQALETL